MGGQQLSVLRSIPLRTAGVTFANGKNCVSYVKVGEERVGNRTEPHIKRNGKRHRGEVGRGPLVSMRPRVESGIDRGKLVKHEATGDPESTHWGNSTKEGNVGPPQSLEGA